MRTKAPKRTESLTKGDGTTGARIKGHLGPPSSKVSKRSIELHMKVQRIHQHNVCFRGGTAGVAKVVQEGRLVLVAEHSKVSAEC